MRRSALIAFLFLVPLLALSADAQATIAKADQLHDQGRQSDARDLLFAAVSAAAPKDQAELYWRLSRETLNLGDQADNQKQPKASILKIFDEGEGYADKAIAADPQSYLGYYWKSANIGRWGQVKGILDSLFRAGPMKDLLVKDIAINSRHADAYYVLGQLYRELPGWPLSFGNTDFAVSLGRLAVDLRADQVKKGEEKSPAYNFYTELGKTLYKRNRSAEARLSSQKGQRARYDSAKNDLDRGCAYEGTVTLKNMSDREEAKALVQFAVAELEKKQARTYDDNDDLDKAREVLKGW